MTSPKKLAKVAKLASESGQLDFADCTDEQPLEHCKDGCLEHEQHIKSAGMLSDASTSLPAKALTPQLYACADANASKPPSYSSSLLAKMAAGLAGQLL